MTSSVARAEQTRRRAARFGGTVSDSWSAAEERALRVEFRRGASVDEMAALHGRAVHDVRSRLVRLGEAQRAFGSASDPVSPQSSNVS